jgi:tetratricopeptide (TPR) repeat protein
MRVIAAVLFLSARLWSATTAIEEARSGVALARQQQYEAAIRHYRAAIALDPHLPGLDLDLGLAYFKLNRFADAATALERAVTADPGGFQAHTLLGMSYYGCGKYREAAAQLARAASSDPENMELHYSLAQSYLWSGQYQAALDEFRRLANQRPDSAPVHMLLGEALDAAQNAAAATAEFEAAARISPQQPDVHFGLGYLYWKQKRYAEAGKQFEAELAGVPDHTQALAFLGDVEMRAGNEAQAKQHLSRALRPDGKIRLAHLDLGILLADRQPQAAAAHFQEAIRFDPRKTDAHYRLARLWLSMNRKPEADAELARVKRLQEEQHDDLLVKLATAPR